MLYPETFDLFSVHPDLTDLGNAERFALVMGKDCRWIPAWKKWLHWDGTRWNPDDREITMRTVQTFVRYCRGMAGQMNDSKRRPEILAFLARCEGREKINATIELARARLATTPEALDKNPWIFNARNASIDLKTGEPNQPNREDLITKSGGVDYLVDAVCPRWERFLDQVMLGSPELIRFLLLFAGYCLTGLATEQVFAIWFGLGANGKSVLINVLLGVMGDYAREMPADLLLIRRNDAISNDVAALRGLRFVTCNESDAGGRLAESRLKQLTGGDAVTARFLYGEFFTFKPEFKLALRTNHRPSIRGTDHAVWRRIALVPFNYKVPEEQRNPHLAEELLAEEGPGILNWMIRGCLEWQREGLHRPAEVEAATSEYREAEDILGGFLAENTAPDRNARTPSSKLYSAYCTWAEGSRMHPMSQKRFSLALEERGMTKKKDPDGMRWLGILLKGGTP